MAFVFGFASDFQAEGKKSSKVFSNNSKSAGSAKRQRKSG
jgi:hypothetical protein